MEATGAAGYPREPGDAPAPHTPSGAIASWIPADPAPLGLAGFSLTTFMLGMVNANFIDGKDVFAVLSVAAAYGGLAQLLAGMWAFREGNTFAAVAFSSYGAFWISFVFLVQFFLPEANAATAGHAVALYLFCWGFFTFYMWIGTFALNTALWLVFGTLWIAYLLLGLGDLGGGSTTIAHIGGYVTILCALIAWYTGAALVLNRTLGRVVLPLGGPLLRPAVA
ncbi:MAG: acetate uptake transporter [Solirubrobacteraceae bacterium]